MRFFNFLLVYLVFRGWGCGRISLLYSEPEILPWDFKRELIQTQVHTLAHNLFHGNTQVGSLWWKQFPFVSRWHWVSWVRTASWAPHAPTPWPGVAFKETAPSSHIISALQVAGCEPLEKGGDFRNQSWWTADMGKWCTGWEGVKVKSFWGSHARVPGKSATHLYEPTSPALSVGARRAAFLATAPGTQGARHFTRSYWKHSKTRRGFWNP